MSARNLSISGIQDGRLFLERLPNGKVVLHISMPSGQISSMVIDKSEAAEIAAFLTEEA